MKKSSSTTPALGAGTLPLFGACPPAQLTVTRRYDAERQHQVTYLRRHYATTTLAQLATALQLTVGQVRGLAKQAGLRKRHYTHHNRRAVRFLQRYYADHTLKELEALLGIPWRKIQYLCRVHGIRKRRPNQRVRPVGPDKT